jgi:transcriptional regulator with PAS, ATPase and Fis domain
MSPTVAHSRPPAIDQILGSDPAIREVRRIIGKAARSPARSILIYGETGTGKGLAARAIHELSQRGAGPFVDINCAAIPTELIESELFGHERGAFTGAVTKKIGLVEAATTGTLFLDEVRELTPVLQAKLLTLIDTQRFRRIGSVQPIAVDVRFVAATNRILFDEVRAGRFREDLYYRLQVIAINLPPLRERGEDILFLADHFLGELSERYGRRQPRLSQPVRDIFLRYRWPGNVRELQHLLERIVALDETDVVEPGHIPPRVTRDIDARPDEPREPDADPAGVPAIEVAPIASVDAPPTDTAASDFHEATRAFQHGIVTQALSRSGGNVALAATALGLSRHALRHQMMRLGILPAGHPDNA